MMSKSAGFVSLLLATCALFGPPVSGDKGPSACPKCGYFSFKADFDPLPDIDLSLGVGGLAADLDDLAPAFNLSELAALAEEGVLSENSLVSLILQQDECPTREYEECENGDFCFSYMVDSEYRDTMFGYNATIKMRTVLYGCMLDTLDLLGPPEGAYDPSILPDDFSGDVEEWLYGYFSDAYYSSFNGSSDCANSSAYWEELLEEWEEQMANASSGHISCDCPSSGPLDIGGDSDNDDQEIDQGVGQELYINGDIDQNDGIAVDVDVDVTVTDQPIFNPFPEATVEEEEEWDEEEEEVDFDERMRREAEGDECQCMPEIPWLNETDLECNETEVPEFEWDEDVCWFGWDDAWTEEDKCEVLQKVMCDCQEDEDNDEDGPPCDEDGNGPPYGNGRGRGPCRDRDNDDDDGNNGRGPPANGNNGRGPSRVRRQGRGNGNGNGNGNNGNNGNGNNGNGNNGNGPPCDEDGGPPGNGNGNGRGPCRNDNDGDDSESYETTTKEPSSYDSDDDDDDDENEGNYEDDDDEDEDDKYRWRPKKQCRFKCVPSVAARRGNALNPLPSFSVTFRVRIAYSSLVFLRPALRNSRATEISLDRVDLSYYSGKMDQEMQDVPGFLRSDVTGVTQNDDGSYSIEYELHYETSDAPEVSTVQEQVLQLIANDPNAYKDQDVTVEEVLSDEEDAAPPSPQPENQGSGAEKMACSSAVLFSAGYMLLR